METRTQILPFDTKTGIRALNRLPLRALLMRFRNTRMPITKTCCLALGALLASMGLRAQTDFRDYSAGYIGEIGVEGGVAQYFGDLNTHSSFRSLKPTAGVFYRYFFTEYFGASAHVHFAQVGFSDYYNRNDYQHTRNLSFDSNLWDISLQGDMNFFRFEPGSLSYRFTPFFTLGIGALHFNPYTYYQDKKYYLQPLGTEGQGSPLYPDRKPYALWTFEIPLGVGAKYNLNRSWNVAVSATYHFTGSDYIDDVSTTYAGPGAFPPGVNGKQTIASVLQDRSGVYGTPIGIQGRQRGNSRDRDQYIGIEISLSYLLDGYHCPEF